MGRPTVRHMADFPSRPEGIRGWRLYPGGFHSASIAALRAASITVRLRDRPAQLLPDRPVIRSRMATFLTRAPQARGHRTL